MDDRTLRELDELKKLRQNLQLQRDLPKRIEETEAALKQSEAAWEASIKRQADAQAQKAMTMQKPTPKATNNEKTVNREIDRTIEQEWRWKKTSYNRFSDSLKKILMAVSVGIILCAHVYIAWQVYQQISPVFTPSFTLHPNYYEDIATDQSLYLLFAIGQLIISACLNGALCVFINKFAVRGKE